jgi:hypothetical protein
VNNWIIILPQEPTLTEEFAASELQKYIGRMTGRPVSVKNDSVAPENEYLFIIGAPKRNRLAGRYLSQQQFEHCFSGSEGFMIKAFGSSLLLAGHGNNLIEESRATLYSVYELLERYLGCAFVAYGKPGSDIGEFVPAIDTIDIADIEYIKQKADLPYRSAIVQFDGNNKFNADANHKLTPSFIDWMAKNRLNRIHLCLGSYHVLKNRGVLEELKKRGIMLQVGHHDSGTFFLPPKGNEYFLEKYFDTHPEYFKLLENGSRYLPITKWRGQLVYDMRNTDCIRQFADNIKKWIKDNPLVDVIDIWPYDSVDKQCTCDKCMSYSKMENYAHFVNEIAKLVRADYPHVKICMIVYEDLRRPPKDLKLDDGVLVQVSTWGGEYDPSLPNFGQVLRSFGKKDGGGLRGTEVEEYAMGWSQIAENVVYYDYYMTNFGSEQVYCPMADEICSIYEHFSQTGYCRGAGSQMEAYNLWNYLFNFYVHGRKGYDVSLTFEELLERFVRIFGKGGYYIKQYISYVEDFYEGQESDGTKSAAWFATHIDKEKIYGLFEKAYESEERYRDNIRLLRMAFRYSDLHVNDSGCDELKYMSQKYGSFWGLEGQTGYGISVLDKPSENGFEPDKWYGFDS